MRTPLRASVLLAFALVAAGCGNPAGYAAKVNGVEITRDVLDAELDAIVDNKEYLANLEENNVPVRGKGDGTFDATFVSSVLTRQILFELVHQEIIERDITITEFDRDRARVEVEAQVGGPEIFKGFPKSYRDVLVEKNAEVTAFQAAVADVDIGERAMKAYYEEHRDEFVAATCVRHIQVESQEQADALRAQIAGGTPFADVAKEHSKDPDSGERGGDIGCFTPGQFPGPFADEMERLPVGELSQPVQSGIGFHLLEVTSRDVAPFEQSAAQVRSRMLEAGQDAFVAEVKKMVKGAEVRVHPRYGTFESEPEPRVVPPDREKLPTTTVPLAPPLGFDPSGVPDGSGPPPGAGSDGGPDPGGQGGEPPAP